MNNKPHATNPLTILISSIIALFFTLSYPANSVANNHPFIESKTKVVLTDKETRMAEEEWSKALEKHTKKLAQAFQQYSPDDYCSYIKFKKKNWEPAFSKDHDIIYNRWIAISDRWSLRYNKLHEIFTAWANLNNASIYMECYLRVSSQ